MRELRLLSKNKPSITRQSGLTLLELLIAMVIGLFLMIGVSASYVSSKATSVVRDQLSQLDENGRVALEILANTLEHTGFKSTNLDILETPFITDGDRISAVSCDGTDVSVVDKTIFPNNHLIDSDTTGDVIGVVYLGDNDLNTDCANGVLPEECRTENDAAVVEAHEIYNTFYIDSDKNLQCAGSRSTEAIPIAEGVENMQILYGVDDDNNEGVDRYVNATAVEAAGDWNAVVSIQIAILVRSPLQAKKQAEVQTFSLLDVPVTTNNDRYHRAVFSTTINLRNQLL